MIPSIQEKKQIHMKSKIVYLICTLSSIYQNETTLNMTFCELLADSAEQQHSLTSGLHTHGAKQSCFLKKNAELGENVRECGCWLLLIFTV